MNKKETHNPNISYNLSSKNRLLSQEQYQKIVAAIGARKYSWACLLILRFAGDNPRLYIPYRTMNRLMKADRAVRSDDRDL